MVEVRKIITMRETIFSELGVAAPRPVVRAVGMAVILNPFAGRFDTPPPRPRWTGSYGFVQPERLNANAAII